MLGPQLSVDHEVHDYGTVEKGGNGHCKFIVTNTGTEPLIISKCEGSCGCTVPECSMKPIMPNEHSEILVKYDTSRVGPFQKSVTVFSNCASTPILELRVKGQVAAASTQRPTP